MVDVQPGKVPTNDPSVTLTNYDDSDRTRFLHNGTQFVKAKLIIARPTSAKVGYIDTDNSEVLEYTEYLNTSSKYVLVDDSKYTPVATGEPDPGYGQYVIVEYPVQVSTDQVVIWSTSRISFYDSFLVQYSFDGSFYFTVSGSSVAESYDSTVQRSASDSPPSGEWKYVISLGATYTGRFFKISVHHTAVVSADVSKGSESTLTVDDTSGFPSSWLTSDYVSLYDGLEVSGPSDVLAAGLLMTYTGLTSTTFTGVTLDFSNVPSLEATWTKVRSGTKIFFHSTFTDDVTEIEVVSVTDPILEVWDTDGSQASSQDMDSTLYYDITYDKDSDVYFSIRYNQDFDGTGGTGFLLGDDFDDSSSGFNSVRWNESTSEPNWQHNTISGTADYLNVTQAGRLTTKYYLDGDFTVDIEPGFNTFSSTTGSIELRSIDNASNNYFVSMGIKGPWQSGGPYGNWQAIQSLITGDTTGGNASIRNLRLDSRYVPEGSEQYIFTYVSASDEWTVVSGSGGSLSNLTPGSTYNEGPLKLSIVHSDTVSDGAQFEITTNVQLYALPVTSPWTWKIGLKKSGTDFVARYDTGTGGFIDWVTYQDTADLNHKIELFSAAVSGTLDLSTDNYVVSGTGFFDNIPVFTVEALNAAGNVITVAGITDASGYVIKRWDIVNFEADYNEYINDRVQIATDHKPAASAGALYFKIQDTIYKYNKSDFPLDLEQEATVAVKSVGEIPSTTAKAFSYNAYSQAGLCYVEYDAARSGTYLKTIDTTLLSGTEFEALLDVSSSSYPWAWDVNNFVNLYYVDGTSLKVYDMDENDVAFANVTSVDKIMAAGTSATTAVSATVLNVYGEPMSAKTVTFTVTAGDGAVSPSVACTNASGIASTTYTVGSSVGQTTITASASDISC